MVQNYKKATCRLCMVEKKTFWYYPLTDEEDKDIFWSCDCSGCKDILIVYKFHNEPSDAEVEHMIDWGKKTFPFRIPDFERRTIKDHFHFHMRRGNGKIDLKNRKTYFQCPQCGQLEASELMAICGECHLIQCKSCLGKNGCLGCQKIIIEAEENLEETQLDDMDTVENEDWE